MASCLPNMLHAVFMRSVPARARLLGVDPTAALACAGVVALLNGSHLAGCTLPAINPLLVG